MCPHTRASEARGCTASEDHWLNSQTPSAGHWCPRKRAKSAFYVRHPSGSSHLYKAGHAHVGHGKPEARSPPQTPTWDTRLGPPVRQLSVQQQFFKSGERTPHCREGPFLSRRDGRLAQQAKRCALTSGRRAVSGAGSHGSHESEDRQGSSVLPQTRLNGLIVQLAQPGAPTLGRAKRPFTNNERLGFCCYSWLLRALNI